jgi:DNA-binding transcriptional regulator PaaX
MAAGILSVGLLAPNAIGAMGRLGLLPSKRQKEIIEKSSARLVKRGLLEYQGSKLRLTPKGEAALRMFELHSYRLKRPKRWDGKWRVLAFDIPEKRKKVREQVRRTLVSIGFIRLQDSVWVYPYNCEDLITLLKADLKVGKDMLYMVVDQLEYDAPLRSRFGI